jgi:hydrogenase expression/formation protein HypC
MADLSRYGTCTLDQEGCVTCNDTAVPVRVIRLLADDLALCEDQAEQQAEVAITFTPGTVAGDVLLVHMGVAIARLEGERGL